ncbi:MAG: sulfatase-like hydrolase/transferase [Prevotella sp.]|nr:sulfatase-like hydrolase/transferase [Prevotella sp.]
MKKYQFSVLLYQYALATLLLAILFASYMVGNQVATLMNLTGWIFFFTSCLVHASILMIIPVLVIGLPLTLCKVSAKVSGSIIAMLYAFIFIIAVANKFIFSIYHFHINAFIIQMFTGPAAGDIFVFGTSTYALAAFYILLIIITSFALLWMAFWLKKHPVRNLPLTLFSVLIISALLSQGIHAYSGLYKLRAVMESKELIPYYFPIRINSVFKSLGMATDESIEAADFKGSPTAFLNYPLHPIVCEEPDTLLNIVWICIDSWSYRTLQPDCAPHIYKFSERAQRYTNHFSGANETMNGTFSLFTGLPSYYWQSFEYGSVQPVLTDQLLKHGYFLDTYPSATLVYPPIAKMYYRGVNVRKDTPGESTYERDCNLTKLFCEKLEQRDVKKPFFSFLFYDGCHSMIIPKEQTHHFKPSWEEPEYLKLNNSIDPTPFFNLYRNCVYVIDSLVNQVLTSIEDHGLMDNTMIVITGDHGQEFNENKKNFWGHSSNYSRAQVGTPLVVYYPNIKPEERHYRTTHYDIVPTVLTKVLGVKNPPEDYSMGYLLDDQRSRNWQYVGKVLDWAFIVDNDVIIEKNGNGTVDIFDKHMTPLYDYPIDSKSLNSALQQLRRFFRE